MVCVRIHDLAPIYEPLLTSENPDYCCWQVIQEEIYERPPRLRVSVTVTEVRRLRPGIVQHNDVELFTVRASSATLCVGQKGNRMRGPRVVQFAHVTCLCRIRPFTACQVSRLAALQVCPRVCQALSAMQMVSTTYLMFALIASSGPACDVHVLEDAHATTQTHDSAKIRVPR